MSASNTFLKTLEGGGGGREREREGEREGETQILQGKKARMGLGPGLWRLHFGTPAPPGGFVWWSRVSVWAFEGDWVWRRPGVGVVGTSKFYPRSSAEFCLQTQLHVREGLLVLCSKKKKWPCNLWLQSTHIPFVRRVRSWFIHCRLLK